MDHQREYLLSASSSSLSSLSSNRQPQHGYTTPYEREHVRIVRQTPPSWSNGRQRPPAHSSYVTPQRRIANSPLVLDPSAQRQQPKPPSSIASEGSDASSFIGGATAMRRILQAATTTRKKRDESMKESPTSHNQDEEYSAASFARTAPQAGFLAKRGSTEYKRRFFVLKPSTHLYYFVSPADTEPRGCIDLEHSTISSQLEPLPDGRCRFSLFLPNSKQIILEARSRDVAQQWIQSMQIERLEYCKQETSQLQATNAELQARIDKMERQLQEYKLVEKDRDGALEDAANWKSQFERLNEGLRLLTQHVRRPPTDHDETAKQQGELAKEEGSRNDDDGSTNDNKTASSESNDETKASPEMKTPQRDTSLLDNIGDEEQPIDDLEFPGTHFSSLLNACQQLRESLRLASVEAASAVDDLQSANEAVLKTEKRMAKAEKHICKLWEENCAMRKTLKQNKAEKRVLVKEVKSLMGVVNSTSEKLRDMSSAPPPPQASRPTQTDNDDGMVTPRSLPTEEERLIDELEEHVMTSIRLHEQFLGVNHGLADQLQDSVKKIESGTYAEHVDDDESELASRPSSRLSLGTETSATLPTEHEPMVETATVDTSYDASTTTRTDESANLSPIRPTLLSLFDDGDSDDDNDSSDDGEEESRSPSLISSVGAEFGDYENDDDVQGELSSVNTQESSSGRRQIEYHQIPQRMESHYSSFAPLLEDDQSVSVASEQEERRHPILQIDDEIEADTVPPNLCASSTQSESSKSIVTDNGNATSRLVCPLADVAGMKKQQDEVDPGISQNGTVYHLTFYSRKIGIQFQKVPAGSSSRGLLTEAMTTDLPTGSAASASSDLKRIAAISSLANSSSSRSTHNKSDDVCQVATPVDAVLVCGFHGFVDLPNQPRPKLGARLVAFDGVSVEIGKWTFDSVRKAIQARGRPLTLSFRNDFLTTKQRAILTKAVADVEKAAPPRRTIQYTQTLRPASTGPSESIISTQSHETDHFVNDACPLDDDDLSVSVASSTFPCTFGRSSRSTSSVGSYQNFRSFSEAGSSSVFSSTSALVGNLMNGLAKNKKRESIPQYLRSDDASRSSLENAPHHQDFTSGLL